MIEANDVNLNKDYRIQLFASRVKNKTTVALKLLK